MLLYPSPDDSTPTDIENASGYKFFLESTSLDSQYNLTKVPFVGKAASETYIGASQEIGDIASVATGEFLSFMLAQTLGSVKTEELEYGFISLYSSENNEFVLVFDTDPDGEEGNWTLRIDVTLPSGTVVEGDTLEFDSSTTVQDLLDAIITSVYIYAYSELGDTSSTVLTPDPDALPMSLSFDRMGFLETHLLTR